MSHEDLHKMCLRSKSILFFSKNAKSFSAAASVDRAGDNYKSVNLVGKVQKAVPLHQQLENLRLQGTERFLSLLTDNESSRPSSEASEIIPKAPSMINGAKPIIRDTTRRSESHIDDAEKSKFICITIN